MKTWEQYIRKVTPYTPGEQPKTANVVKLNTNENPYPPAPGVSKALCDMDSAILRKYPDPDATELVDAIAKYYGVKSNQVFVGVGSDDVPYETIKLDDNFEIIPEDYFRKNGGIVFPNPNAPTAVEMSIDKVEKIIKNNQDSVVIVDEAYVDFGATSALKFIEKYDNVLVVRTF